MKPGKELLSGGCSSREGKQNKRECETRRLPENAELFMRFVFWEKTNGRQELCPRRTLDERPGIHNCLFEKKRWRTKKKNGCGGLVKAAKQNVWR
jgi:hypothetical protein